MEFYRTFVALPLKVGEEVLQILSALKGSLDGERISWVDPRQFHLTLRFLGDTPADQVKIIGERLLHDIRSPVITMKLTTLGSFGPRRRPRVLWIGFEDSEPVNRLYAETERILTGFGFPHEEQAFRPHLTLGRVRSLIDPNNYYNVIESLKERELGEVRVDRLIYFRSVLGSAGANHTPLYQVMFTD
jgi:2'-5' RNA ligase